MYSSGLVFLLGWPGWRNPPRPQFIVKHALMLPFGPNVCLGGGSAADATPLHRKWEYDRLCVWVGSQHLFVVAASRAR